MKKQYCAAVSSLIPENIAVRLSREFELIFLPPDEKIDKPVSTHPDMIMTILEGHVFVPESYYAAYPDVIGKISSLGGMIPVLSEAYRDKIYPNDVSLNTLTVGKILLCRKKSASPELLEFAEKDGYTVLDTKQGYAGCSCIAAYDSVVTSDKGILSLLTDNGIDEEFVPGDNIRLEGYNHGFIGGCGGFWGGKLYLFGRDNGEVESFAKKRGYGVVYLSDEKLTDWGGIKFFEKKQECGNV